VTLRRVALAAAGVGLAVAAAAPAAAPLQSRSLPERLGYAPGARLLVLHADDLGMSHSVNRATFEALEKGWISSASILVPCPWFPEVARWARAHPEADLGIHLALNSEWTSFRWGPLSTPSEVPSLVDDQGYFPLVETTVAARAKPAEVERELRRQVDRARSAGITLSHLDSHMGALFQSPALFAVYEGLGKTYGLPLLLQRSGDGGRDDALIDRVLAIEPGVPAGGWLAAYQKLLEPLPPGAYQVIVHLGYDDEEMRGATSDHPDWGAQWRQSDLDLVRGPQFRDWLKAKGFTLVRWRDLAGRR
jgi:chitin disaccharide deacetylase